MSMQQQQSEIVISARKLTKIYRTSAGESLAIENVDIDVMKAEFVALVGPSGAGKSTLLSMLGCMTHPSSGELSILGRQAGSLSDREMAKMRNQEIGFVFQSFNLIQHLSVFKNVEMPLLLHNLTRAERYERVEQALDSVGLVGFGKKKADELSGGQKQRVAIARALSVKPHFILADEPTANLDSETAGQVISIIKDLNRKHGVTFIVSTHDERLIVCAAKIYKVQNGTVKIDKN